MALIVIEAATEHDMAGNLEPSEVSMQEQICTSIAEALRHCLQMLPERIELFEKGLVSRFQDNHTPDLGPNSLAYRTFSQKEQRWTSRSLLKQLKRYR